MATPARELLLQGRERFLALPLRTRWIAGIGGLIVLLTIVYLLLVEPLLKAHERQLQALASARAMAVQLEQAAAAVRAAGPRNAAAAQAGRGVSLLAAVDQATKQGALGKAPERLQPEGEREVRVWFDDVPFDNLVRWIAELQARYGISVQTLDVEPQSAPGLVDARLSLTRDGG